MSVLQENTMSEDKCAPENASTIGVLLDGATQRLNCISTVALSLIVYLHLQRTTRGRGALAI